VSLNGGSHPWALAVNIENLKHIGKGVKAMLRKPQPKDVEGMEFSRRRFFAVSSAGAVLLARRPLVAAEEGIVPTMVNAAAKAKIVTKTLPRNISVLEGSGGNIAVLSGRDGKLLVDAGFTVSRPALSTALTAISADPIKQLINTHWHTDHTDGNAWLHDAGAAITAHENTRKHLLVATRVDAWNYTFPAAPSGAIPAKVFKTNSEMRWNDTRLLLRYYGPAHTDSDISVNFTDADVLHVGDTWWNGVYPFIDYSTGGSIDGSIRAAETNLGAVTSKTIVIPGHGPVGGKSGMTEFRDMLVAIREKVAALKKQGRSLDEAIAAKPTAAYDAKWGQFLITPAMFTGLVYQGV
jgi:glyoxylase-like metal-dependent hydrolase (beta-lactamase superfamily II)